ncbi:MAG: 30S ribosomal protein S1 [Parvularculales bacterium]
MTDTATGSTTESLAAPSREEFAAMLEDSFTHTNTQEGTVTHGKIVAIEQDCAVIDVGLKTEGRVPLKEFSIGGVVGDISIGDEVEVYLERVENAVGEAVLSRDKARREESLRLLEEAHEAGTPVDGVIFGRVRGGFTVDLGGATAFLPGSQVDVRPVRDIAPYMNTQEHFQILKMDRRRGNIVVSRRAVLEEARAEQRNELVQNLAEGSVLEGVVKNITDYGAFVDLGGIDGLLHVTDIAWQRVHHPSDVLSVGQTVKVQVTRINQETQRISLGMKQLESDPWESVVERYPVDTKFMGRVTNITDYGAFVELEPGIEGLVHVSEMSWVKKNVHPGKIISTSQEVEVMVLEVDPAKRRVSLGLKQCGANPWEDFSKRFPKGTLVEGPIKNITDFGMFIGLDGDVDGMIHMSDLDWNKPGEEALAEYEKSQNVKAVVLGVDIEKERISLGVKQLSDDPMGELKKGAIVTCTVVKVQDNGIEVEVGEDGMQAYIRRGDLSRMRAEQRPERFARGDKIDAQITQFDPSSRTLGLSIKALEIVEEKEAVKQYGSSDSGASLGSILGAALKRVRGGDGEGGDQEASEEDTTKS